MSHLDLDAGLNFLGHHGDHLPGCSCGQVRAVIIQRLQEAEASDHERFNQWSERYAERLKELATITLTQQARIAQLERVREAAETYVGGDIDSRLPYSREFHRLRAALAAVEEIEKDPARTT